MGSTNPLDSVGLDDTPQHRSHHYQQRSPDMRHRSSKAREAATALSQQTVSVMKVQTEVEEYAETSVTVKVRDLYPRWFFNLFGSCFSSILPYIQIKFKSGSHRFQLIFVNSLRPKGIMIRLVFDKHTIDLK